MESKMLNPHQKASLLKHLEMAWEAANEMPTTTPCGACTWNKAGYCKKWQDQIPADVIPKGCAEFHFNPESVPF